MIEDYECLLREVMAETPGIQLTFGAHKSPAHGLCIMEAAAMLGREAHSDNPKCVAPTIREFSMQLNDLMTDDERIELVPFIDKVVGTAYDEDLAAAEQKRGFLCADYAVRVFAPIQLRAVGFNREAERLEQLPTIVDASAAFSAAAAAGAAGAAAFSAAAGAAGDAAFSSSAFSSAASASAAADAASAAGAAAFSSAASAAAFSSAAFSAGAASRKQLISKAVELLSKMI